MSSHLFAGGQHKHDTGLDRQLFCRRENIFSMEQHIWVVREYDDVTAANLAREAGISPITAALLVQRGCLELEQVRSFLNPTLDSLSDPWRIAGIKEAVKTIHQAVANQIRVIIYGDYDVDGVCSTVILKEGLEMLGCMADYYIPDRFKEGYGLNEAAVTELARLGYGLLITVDCGIRSIEEVARAAHLGMQVVITDHHVPGAKVPAAAAVVNPKLGAPESARELSGAGVVYQLIRALLAEGFAPDMPSQWLDLAAMATVADVVPMVGDNRILVKTGLEIMAHTTRPGLRCLLEDNGLLDRLISPWQVGFVLGPRLNSAGRLQHAKLSVELLMASDAENACYLASVLGQLNEERKKIEEIIYGEALMRIHNDPVLLESGILVLDGNRWHHGVLGIVASRLCEQYRQPVILISWEEETGRGSCRSLPGIDIGAVLGACQEHLLQFGGHPMAAGLSIEKKSLTFFKQAVSDWIQVQLPEAAVPACQFIDLELDPSQITETLYEELQLLEPYGEGNPAPVMAVRSVELAAATMVGKQKEHFKARLFHSGLEVIAFRKPEYKGFPSIQCRADIAFHLDNNEFRGKKSLQLKVRRMKPAYRPDNDAGSNGSGLENAWIHRLLAELNSGRPALCVFPTYRTMIAGKRSLDQWLCSPQLHELNGRMTRAVRTAAEMDLSTGFSSVYLTTDAYLQYFLKHQHMPENLQYIAHFHAGQDAPTDSCLAPHHELIPIFPALNQVIWYRAQPGNLPQEKLVVYVNRSKSIQQWRTIGTVIFCEAGVTDWNQRASIRRAFNRSDKGILITDGYASGWPLPGTNGLLLADAPFSAPEMGHILAHICETPKTLVGILFDDADMESNMAYLERTYPDVTTVKGVVQALVVPGRETLEDNMENICRLVSARTEIPISPTKLVSALRILTDLGLCQCKKKGSIMAIKFMRHQKTTFHIAESPYFQEGLVEKKACQEWINQLKNTVTW